MMNGPRALINFNDGGCPTLLLVPEDYLVLIDILGFGGGNVIEENLMFNANRETSDQYASSFALFDCVLKLHTNNCGKMCICHDLERREVAHSIRKFRGC